MWVEPDTDMPTGEALVRQLLYGQRYFEKTFGKRHDVCWLPDCFGFSPALPQLLLQAGVDSFFTIKVNWSETNKMPFDLFWWEGLDGSRVLAHTFDNPVGGYNAEIGPRAVVETWRNFRGKHLHPESLLAFGYGDGGGGPTEEMLDRQRQFADFPVVPALRPVGVADWFAAVREAVEADPELPVWVGEMYLELHRGTLTTQGRTKFLNRRAERALITAETLSSMAALLGEPVAASLEDQWRILLRNQFHDILPGSSIREVYELAEAELALGRRRGRSDLRRAARVDRRPYRPAGRPAGSAGRQSRPLAAAAPARVRGRAAGRPGGRGRQRAFRHARTVPGLSAAVVIDDEPRPGLSVGDGRLENADHPRRDRAGRHARQRLRQARRARGPGRSRQPDLGLCRQAAELGRLGHRGELCAPGQRDPRERAARGRRARPAPRGHSRGPPLPRQRDRADGAPVGELRPRSSSRPTSTGTSAGCC